MMSRVSDNPQEGILNDLLWTFEGLKEAAAIGIKQAGDFVALVVALCLA